MTFQTHVSEDLVAPEIEVRPLGHRGALLLIHNIYKFSSYFTGSTIHLRSVARNSDHRGSPELRDKIRINELILNK
jgi:hypothetical protein